MISSASRQFSQQLNDLRERWQIRKELPNEKEWMPVIEFEKSISGMNRNQLFSIKAELLEIHSKVKGRLGNAKSRLKIKGNKSDDVWFQEQQAARRSIAIHIEVVNRYLGVLKVESLKKRDNEFGQRFIATAKKELEPELFKKLIELSGKR